MASLVHHNTSAIRPSLVKMEFHGIRFLVASSWHPRDDLAGNGFRVFFSFNVRV